MGYPLAQALAKIANARDRAVLQAALSPVYGGLSSQSLATAGLAIKAAAGVLVKTGAAVYYGLVNGTLVTKAAATDMAALSGTVANAKFNVFVFTVDAAGTLYSQMGGEGVSLAAVKFPALAPKRAILGFVVVNPTGTGNFVGGTTALDDATVIPNAAYINIIGNIDPSATI